MKLELNTPESEPPVHETLSVFQTDLLLRDNEDWFNDKPCKLP